MKHRATALIVLGLVSACDKAPPEQPGEPEWTNAQPVDETEAPAVAPEELAAAENSAQEAAKLIATAPPPGEKVLAIKGPDNRVDVEAARNLGANKRLEGLDALVGDSRGFGGLGLHGAGRGGGGISERGIGLGTLGVGGKGGSGYGKGSAGLSASMTLGRGAVVANRGAVVSGNAYRSPEHVSDPVAREGYKNHGTNHFTDPSEDPLSTFSIDVDTGSYTIARRKLTEGSMPPKDSVRVEEFVNYFRYDYPEPDAGAFSVSMEAAPSPFATSGKTYLMRVGIQGKTIQEANRKPVHLTFLVDVSGSMSRPDKIGLVEHSLEYLTENLRESDTVAIATYAGRTEILLEPTGVKHRQRILDAIAKLSAGGSTAMDSGLDLAYRLAGQNFVAKHENRVIVLSDGDANVGKTGWDDMLKTIGGQVKKGVTLSTIGFGMGNYQDHLMEQLADHGNGNYYYIDSEKEAERIFGDQIDGTLQVIAKDVKIQVEFNSQAVERYRLIGYENRDIADKDFRNDKVDAGEIGAGHRVTALYEVVLKDELPDNVATVRVRHKQPHGSDKASELAFGLDRDDLKSSIAKSSKDFQFAASVCAFAEKLRHSPYAKNLTWDWIEEIASSAAKGRSDRKELVKLIQRARKLS